MAKVTIGFGLVLVAIGIWGYVATGHEHPTALIPALIGLVLAICGALAITEDAKKRMLWMHIAVTVGALGMAGTVKGAVETFKLAHGTEYPHPIAVVEKGATCLFCLLFVAFCVRSFVMARRTRLLGA